MQKRATNADPDIECRNLAPADQAALLAFLQTLTDPRVANESAPFDHPSLKITNGHRGNNDSVVDRGNGKAVDERIALPAVGRLGRSVGQGVGVDLAVPAVTAAWDRGADRGLRVRSPEPPAPVAAPVVADESGRGRRARRATV